MVNGWISLSTTGGVMCRLGKICCPDRGSLSHPEWQGSEVP
ncbi:MAG: hypothetical protein ACLUFY_06705 [[Ruminococcus] torques]